MTGITRTAFFYGPDSRPLFAWMHAPSAGACSGIAAVLCPGLGHEFVHSYLSMRHLADDLASRGVLVLRMEYDGTGSCAGVDEEPARVAAWLQSIRAALAELRGDPRAQTVGLIGFRLGANLAIRIANEEGHDLDFLVAWAAIPRSRAYVRELKAMQLTGEVNGSDPRISDGAIEAAGFIYSPETQQDLAGLDTPATRPHVKRALWVARDEAPDDGATARAWRGADIAVTETRLTGVADMLLPAAVSVVPQRAIDAIVDWVCPHVTQAVDLPPVSHGHPFALFQGEFVLPDNIGAYPYQVREDILTLGDAHPLFAILTSPSHTEVNANAPIIVMTNAGSVHQMGPHRLYVMLARTLAQLGFRVLRVDISGKGDSDPAPGREENIVYSPLVVGEIEQAMNAMHARFPRTKILLMGLCSGAHDAFHAGARARGDIVETIMINPLSFYWEEGRKITDAPNHLYSHWDHYMRSIRDWRRWVKLFQGKANVGKIARLIMQRARLRLGLAQPATKGQDTKNGTRPKPREDLAADLHAIHAHGRRMSFIIADTDPGVDILMTRAGRAVKKLRRLGALSIERIAESNHTFTSRTARRTVIARIVAHLQGRYT